MEKPKIFVGSSSEAESLDRQIRYQLENLGAHVIGWRDVFKTGDYTLDALIEVCRKADGALLLITPDDLTNHRNIERMSPRDNILIELGMFLATLGKYRTAIVHVKKTNGLKAALPSDLSGLTTLQIDEEKNSQIEYVLSKWLEGVKGYFEKKNPNADEIVDLIKEKIWGISRCWQYDVNKYVLDNFRRSIELLHIGEIILSATEYYYSLFSEIDKANEDTEIIAVAMLSSAIQTIDPEQKLYIDKNIKAAQRGAKIKRLFVVSEKEWAGISKSIQNQINEDIEIRRSSPKVLGELTELEDMAIFFDKRSGVAKGYIADLGFNIENRIRRGRLVLDAHNRKGLIDSFKRAWKLATPVSSKSTNRQDTTSNIGSKPPVDNMKIFKLGLPVVSCEEAAEAKNIPLNQELKSLILRTTSGLVALHLPGDSQASLRKVKNALDVEEAHMADLEDIESLGLEPGTISAVSTPVWEMPHLISKRVLSFEFVSTNARSKKEFVNFPPSLLMEAESVMLGDFEA